MTCQWGDAAVHTLALGLLLKPEEVHHFSDLAYRHDHLYTCPGSAPGRQLLGSELLGDEKFMPEEDGALGCRCECKMGKNYLGYCLNKLKQPTSRIRPWLTWFL